MKAVLIWKDCSLFQKEQDGFWMQCPSSELEEKVLPHLVGEQRTRFLNRKEYFLSTKWAISNPGLLVEPDSYYFIISRDGKEVQPTDPFFPYSSQWYGGCPLEEIDIISIDTINDLNTIYETIERDSKVEMNTQLVEIASWRIVSELHRRYPSKFKIIETHPGGGLYDCLALFDEKKRHIADFNREGSLHVFETFDNSVPQESFDIWAEMYETRNIKDTLDRISSMLGLPVPSKLPSSTPTTLVYRFISAFLTHSAFDTHRWECRNGCLDTAGPECGGKRHHLFEKFPGLRKEENLRKIEPFFGEYEYNFWFLIKNRDPFLCLDTSGIVYRRDGKFYDLALLYKGNRKIWSLIIEVARDILP